MATTTIQSSDVKVSRSFYIHDIFNTPKEEFENFIKPFLQSCGNISRIDYAVNRNEDSKERVMAFIHFRDFNEESIRLQYIRKDIADKGHSDIYIMPRGRYYRLRENKTPINETTMNLDQVAHCATENAENIEKHSKRFDDMENVLSEFVLDTNTAISKQSFEILRVKEQLMEFMDNHIDSVRNEMQNMVSQYQVELEIRDTVLNKQKTLLAEQAKQIDEQNERFSDMEKMHDSMNRIIDKMLENAEKQSNRWIEMTEKQSAQIMALERENTELARKCELFEKQMDNITQSQNNRLVVLENERKYGC